MEKFEMTMEEYCEKWNRGKYSNPAQFCYNRSLGRPLKQLVRYYENEHSLRTLLRCEKDGYLIFCDTPGFTCVNPKIGPNVLNTCRRNMYEVRNSQEYYDALRVAITMRLK